MTTSDDRYFRHLCDSLGFVCIAVDPDLRIRYWNNQAARHFAESNQSIQGRPILDILDPPDRPAAEKLLRDCLASQSGGDLEIKFDRETEEPRTFVLVVSPIIDDEGRCIGASAAMRDISQRKKLSQELARARRMVSLGKMAGAVTHHFNNILGGMMTSIDFALPSDSPRELRSTLRRLAQAIGRATRITQQLAAFAESENVLQEESATLNDALNTFIARFEPKLRAADMKLVTDIDVVHSGLFEMTRLMPVLESLAENAVDAMCAGGVLTLSLKQEDESAVIRISDTGCGMSQEAKEHLFEPFFTTKGELGGGPSANIGLGLAAVHGFVSELDGTISISSAIGKGTTVTLKLPLRRKPAESNASGATK